MENEFTNRQTDNGRYVISGGSSGIGAAVVDHLVREGKSVTTIARRSAANNSPLVESIQCDLSDLGQTGQKLKPLSKFGLINGVVICHGYGDFGCLEQFSDARIQRMINTNLTSSIMLAGLVLPVMKKSGSGTLVIVGSESALAGARQGAVYCATKFALRGFAQALRRECSSSGVRVSIINPGMVDSPFFDPLAFTPGADPVNYLSADDVASAIVTILSAPANVVIDEINLSPLKTVVRHKQGK